MYTSIVSRKRAQIAARLYIVFSKFINFYGVFLSLFSCNFEKDFPILCCVLSLPLTFIDLSSFKKFQKTSRKQLLSSQKKLSSVFLIQSRLLLLILLLSFRSNSTFIFSRLRRRKECSSSNTHTYLKALRLFLLLLG